MDVIAWVLTIVCVASQFYIRKKLAHQTVLPLSDQRDRIIHDMKRITAAVAPSELRHDMLCSEVRMALGAAYPTDAHQVQEPIAAAFSSDLLVPENYNGRLDAAVPGIFTAIGICATFFGLIVSFLSLDFNNAASSIAPLINKMTPAFFNSLVGVGLAIQWTWSSRAERHKWDTAVGQLQRAVRERFGDTGSDRQVLDALSNLRTSVDGSSEAIRSNLVETLATLVERMVEMPFESLAQHVADFGLVVKASTAIQQQVTVDIQAAQAALTDARGILVQAARTASITMESLNPLLNGFREANADATTITKQTESLLHATGVILQRIEDATVEHHNQAAALERTSSAMVQQGIAIGGVIASFEAASTSLHAAVAELRTIGPETATQVAEAFDTRMRLTIDGFSAAMSAAGDRTLAGFQTVSKEVSEALTSTTEQMVRAVDEKFTDLTDRFSAEMLTLSGRLPESTQAIERAATLMRQELSRAVNNLQGALHRLDTEVTATLKVQFAEFDRLLADSVNHFNGTILTWQDKVEELTQAVHAVRNVPIQVVAVPATIGLVADANADGAQGVSS